MATKAPQQNESGQNGRGIQNARAITSDERFNEHAGKRLARVQFTEGNGSKRDRFAANDPLYEDVAENASRVFPLHSQFKEVQRVYKSIQQIFLDADENITDADIDQLKVRRPAKPPFPIFILVLAVIKDHCDFLANVLVVAIPLSMVASFCMSVVLFFWLLGKMSGGWWKRAAIRWLWMRYVVAIIVEMIPFFQIIPATTIFVLMVHYKETKIVKLFDLALEELRRAKVV